MAMGACLVAPQTHIDLNDVDTIGIKSVTYAPGCCFLELVHRSDLPEVTWLLPGLKNNENSIFSFTCNIFLIRLSLRTRQINLGKYYHAAAHKT